MHQAIEIVASPAQQGVQAAATQLLAPFVVGHQGVGVVGAYLMDAEEQDDQYG
ncbi:hypothetical protein D9M70_615340 [compost metagenome]